MVLFSDDIYGKYITIGYDMSNIYLPNITVTGKLYQTPIIRGDYNYLISKEQFHKFGVDVQNIHKCHVGRNYVHTEDWPIPMNHNKYSMYVIIYEPIQ